MIRHPMRDEIERLLRAGGSDKAVALETGVDRGTVARLRRQLDIPGYRATAASPACRHGHPFPENRGFNSSGHLICLECDRAKKRRWWAANAQPAQVDEIAIVRAVAGDPPGRLTPRERRAAIHQLAERQLSTSEIADRVGCSERTVWRALARSASTPAALAPAV